MDDFAGRNLRGNAGLNRVLEYQAETLCSPALTNARQRRMIRQRFMQCEAAEPADRQVHLRLAHQPAVMNDAKQEPGEHQPDRNLGIDTGTAIVSAVKVADLVAQPGQTRTRSTRART